MPRDGHAHILLTDDGAPVGRDAAAYLAEADKRWDSRRKLLGLFAPHHVPVERCERALHACLQAAAMALPAASNEAPQENVFAWFAAHLAGDAVPAAVRERVSEKGLEPEITDALILFPGQAADAWLRELFHAFPAWRGMVMDIWREQGRPPHEAPLPAKALVDEHGEALMAWHAGHPDGDGELLARHYGAPAAGAATPGLACAIEGGLLRGDPAAAEALATALNEAGSEAPPALLDLAALAGLEQALPVLHQVALEEGDEAWLRLAWLGTPDVPALLLEAMEAPRHAESAARAWSLLSGHQPGSVPRLRPVDGEAGVATADDTLPDAAAAAQWLEAHRGMFSPETRWVLGQPAVPGVLAGLARRRAGRFGNVLARRLRLLVARPVPLPVRGWRRTARAAVAQLAEAG